MGTTDSKQRLGEKVIEARKKLEEQTEIQNDRFQFFETKSPQTIKVIFDSIDQSFKTSSPFLEQTLLIAWQSNAKQAEEIILQSCKKVLSAPIIPEEYQWFQKYVLPSSVWFYETNKGKYMFEELLNIVKNMSQDIIITMNSIYSLFENHPRWTQLMNIKNKTIISRQDHVKVGLLKEKGICDVLELKEEKIDEIQTFVDSNLAVNILTTTAKQINDEFQNHMKNVLSHYGTVKGGPIKKIDRCQSKLENDYQSSVFPKAAKLVDLVRCSVTFNTLDQLLDGYKGFMSHIKGNPSMIELARIKNGFLDPNYKGGYRDIKLNVVYHSSINTDMSMICEVQLLLLNYLHEKKRIHKLYSIARQEMYFQMVVKVAEQNENNMNSSRTMKDLTFTPIVKVRKNKLNIRNSVQRTKCSVDTDLGLLGMESHESFLCMDIDSKEMVFEQTLSMTDAKGRHCHHWIEVNRQKYVTVQTSLNTIKMFKVFKKNNKFQFKENESLRISYKQRDVVYFCAFDQMWQNIFIVVNGKIFEQRSMTDINKIKCSVKLEKAIMVQACKQLDLSNDGSLCVIAGGRGKDYIYIIDVSTKKQIKLTSTVLPTTYSPHFINGDTDYVAVGYGNKVEIWNVEKRLAMRIIDLEITLWSLTATNNILAVCGQEGILEMYDVRDWKRFYSENVEVQAVSIHLTSDSRYVTIGGANTGFETIQCVILEIK